MKLAHQPFQIEVICQEKPGKKQGTKVTENK